MAQIPCRTCDFCKDKNKRIAAFYCDGCEQSLCLECKRDIHERVPIFQDHNLININKAGNRVFKLKPVCESHKQKFLYYCSKCDCLACKECMTSSHNGHTTDTIKHIVDVYRKDAQKTQEKLKAKVEIVEKTLETIKTNQMRQIKSDFDSYVQKVEKTSRELHGIVDNIKTINMTTASDFEKIEKQDLNMKRAFFQRQYDESSGTLIQIDNLLQESHDVTFFTDWKRLQTDRLQNMCEIDQNLQNPRRIESFSEDNFMRTVIEEIDKRLKISIFKEKDTEIELLTNAIKEKETLACELQEENDDLYKGLRHKKAETDKLSRQFWGSSTAKAGYRVCAAIDIGSTYSGYAFSSNDDYTKEPTKINTNIWSGSKLLSLKAPTAVLLDSSQEFVAFGYDAENKYSELVTYEEHEDYYYFHRFKMLLNDRRITRRTRIRDALDKEVEALMVFHLTIKYLKDHMFKALRDNIKDIQEDCIVYVLTVPAIWEYSAVEFMREAAIKAGIDSRQLMIVAEPETASVYCQYLKLDRHYTGHKNAFGDEVKSGMMYMVVDLGGGSADITVYQRDAYNGILLEVIPPTSVPWGGKSIDEAFYTFLQRIFGPQVMKEFRKTEPEDFIDFFREFETKKRSIRVDQTNKVVVTLPVALIDLVTRYRGKMVTALEESPYGDSVTYSKHKISILPDTFRDLFKPTIEALVKHLEAMHRHAELRDLKTIVMVGGFSECELVQHKVKERFGRNTTIIIPEEARLAVLKGAVLYGHTA